MKTEYRVYLVAVDDRYNEIHVGTFTKLSPALLSARVACQEAGVSAWDWVVDKFIGEDASSVAFVQRRSSVGGLELL